MDIKKLERFKSSTYRVQPNKFNKLADTGRPIKDTKRLPKAFRMPESGKERS